MKMYPITRVRLWLRSLIAGEKCIACGEMNTRGEGLMCSACEDELKRSHLALCTECSLFARDCQCAPHIMHENGIDVLIKYAFYDASVPEAALNRVIRRLKKIPDGLAFAYFAAILSQPISALSAARGYTKENTLITHIPRSRNGIARDGYDQAYSLAHAIAKRSKFAHKTLIRRVKHAKAQKHLDIEERIKNVKGLFAVKDTDITGKNIILVDDLVTTGATVSEAAKKLYDAGAASVICVCLAESAFRRNKII